MVYVNRVLRRIFGLVMVEVIGSWRKGHNEELHIIAVIKARRTRWHSMWYTKRRGMHIEFQ
jgi:hypothetical protein